MKMWKFFIYFFITVFLLFAFSCAHKSGRKDKQHNLSKHTGVSYSKENIQNKSGKTVVSMENINGIKYIWIEVNGIKLKFIFDTGASSISISSAEAVVLLKQGLLKEEDILDDIYFQDATGGISVGTRINLRTVKIGDRVLRNIEAVVVDNMEAPLLLGQSVLEKFGKITIDNKNNQIIFE